MREEKIQDALNFLDDDMIEQVDKLRSTKGKRKSSWIKSLAVAACFCLILGGIFVYGIHKDRDKPNGADEIPPTLTGNDSEQAVKFPRVLIEIVKWEEGRLVGKILDSKDTDIFKIGSESSVYWEDYIILGAYTEDYEKYLYRNYGAPTQEQFPVGSIIMVDVDAYEMKNADVRYEIYTEYIAYVEE